MSITKSLDGWDHVRNFAEVYVGPGIYVLYDGRVADKNIVYIGKSETQVVMRVRQHERDKGFDRVGVFLPSRTTPDYIHNAEHFIVAEYVDRFGELPLYNGQHPRFKAGGPRFNWHSARRRKSDLSFGGGGQDTWLDSKFRTVGELRRCFDELYFKTDMTIVEVFEVLADGSPYSAATLRNYYYSEFHGNTVLPLLR